MERTKSPTLTSPWKIGFFVSLLLVAISIGVAVLITRAFGIEWSWVAFSGGEWYSPQSWAFRFDRFVHEMLPLALVVPGFSLLSYFLITGAVRAYKKYLDSGVDYRKLVQSIREIEDLQDEANIRKLSNHPELRNFLLSVRNRISEREQALDEKEQALSARAAHVAADDVLSTEASALAGAILNSPGALEQELALSSPHLRKIEKAARERMAPTESGQAAASESNSNLRGEITVANEEVAGMINDLHREIAGAENAAREIETAVNALKSSSRKGPDNSVALEALDKIASAIAAIGEESRVLAINAATHAGASDSEDMVQLADGVRKLAGRFAATAVEWTNASHAAKGTLATAGGTATNDAGAAIAMLANRVAVWVEHGISVSDRVKLLRQHFGDTSSALNVKLGGTDDDNNYQQIDDLAIDEPGQVDVGSEQHEDSGQIFEQQGRGPVMKETDGEPEAPLPGLEKVSALFDEVPAQDVDKMFADIPIERDEDAARQAQEAVESEPEAVSEDDAKFAEMSEPQAAVRHAEVEAEGFIVDPATAPAAEEEDDAPDVIDLYELGAIDYEAESVLHNS